VDSVNSINYILLKYVVKKGGFDFEKDFIVMFM